MQKETSRKTSAKKLETNEKYLQKLDRITVRLYKEGDEITKRAIEEYAAKQGKSVNQFVLDAIKQSIIDTQNELFLGDIENASDD